MTTLMRNGVKPAPFRVGAHLNGSARLEADVGEILIYTGPLAPRDYEAAVDYLRAKWGVDLERGPEGWTAFTVPQPPMTRTRDDLPLQDQANSGNWQRLETLSDEFNGAALDETKWWDHYPGWHGRPPARFLPENVRLDGGHLILTLRKDDTLPVESVYPNQEIPYGGYSSASVSAKSAITYGAFEVRARPARATPTSSWWFIGHSVDEKGGPYSNEIDIYELPSGCVGHEHRYGMNLHVTREPGSDKPWANWGNVEAPFKLADDFHVYGLEWSPEWIRYYIDGHCIRTTRNLAWHTPLQMLFDMEIMTWLPKPDDREFPADYHVDYVRAWTRADWKPSPRFTPKTDPAKPTGVSRNVRALDDDRRAKGLIPRVKSP
jgi:beta-glucanase (GH16 family)